MSFQVKNRSIVRNILFIELLGGIGDLLIALGAIQALARSHPQAQITVLTFAPGGELLVNDPLIARVVYAERNNPRQSVEKLLAESFDLVISDTNYDHIDEIIAANGGWCVTNLWRQPPKNQFVGDRFVEILLAEGVIVKKAITPPNLYLPATAQRCARAVFRCYPRPLIFLIPDAGMSIKQWHPDNFVTLGKALQQYYGATLIIPVGADAEHAVKIVHGIGKGAYVFPRGQLIDLAAALAGATLVVAADTGPARIAAALNVPTITLFGPAWHERYGQSLPNINLQGYPQCPERNISNFTEQRCWYGTCPLQAPWRTCVDAISPTTVLTAAKSLLAMPRESPQLPISPVPMPDAWSQVRNILVMRLDNIGDVIMTSPALRAIKENLPACELTLMASPSGAQAASLLPWVDRVLPSQVLWQDLGSLDFNSSREWQLIQTLRDRQFDAAIIFTSFSQSPLPAAFACYLAGIELRIGESKELSNVLTTEVIAAPDEIHQVERNLRLLEAVGFQVKDRSLAIQIDADAEIEARQLLAQHGVATDTPYILLNPWTSCQSRNYDTSRFAAAAQELAKTTKMPIVVTGVSQDRDRAQPLLTTLATDAIDLIGSTTLPQLAALIAHAQLVLTNNTSTMHIADATRTPSVIMFAGTEYESQWQPRHNFSWLLRRPTPCSPCYAFTCPYNLECLDIPPTQVVAAGLELLARKKL